MKLGLKSSTKKVTREELKRYAAYVSLRDAVTEKSRREESRHCSRLVILP